MTLIETLGALALGSLILMGVSSMIDATVDDAKGQQAALQQERLVNAASRYIAANYADLATGTAAGATTAITLAQLKAGGFLSDGFSATNAFGQAACVLVRQAAPGKLDALVATYGGAAIPDRDLAMVAALAGQGGGYVSAAAPASARGAAWQLSTTSYRNVACGGATVLTGAAANDGGHLVSSLFYDGPGQLASDFLYRNAVPGRPELNQLNAPIGMAGSALVTPGAACGAGAAIGIDDATRRLMVCGKNGLWQSLSSWKESVPTYADLPVAGSSAGDVRVVTGLSRAFVYGAGGWVALAVDEAGNLAVPGTVSADGLRAASQITTDGFITAQKDIRTPGKVSGDNGVEGNYVLGRYWVEGQSIYINQPVNAGEPCHIIYTQPDGSLAIKWAVGTFKHDPNGLLLACAEPERVFKYQNGTLTP